MRTDCTTKPIVFSSHGRRQILGQFDGQRITSDAGGLLLREVDRHLGLIDALDHCILDPRDPELITHRQRSLLAQRIYSIALGYDDLNDHQTLRNDPLLQILCQDRLSVDQPLASAPTLCRLENRVDRAALVKISQVLVETFIASHKQPPAKLMLDFDATHDPVHGNQVGRSFRSFYDCWCFLPLYVFCGDQLLVAYLRPGNCDGAKHAGAILALLVKRLRQAWPKVQIVLRGDSGFCRPKLLSWCEKHGVFYVLGLQINPVLKRIVQPVQRQAQQQFQRTHQKQRWFSEFYYAARTWKRKRRVILRHEHSVEGPNPRFIVTNLPGPMQQLYEHHYCGRGECENRIKEQQLGLFADRTSCHDFAANQFRLLLSAAAYVLLDHLRRLGLTGSELAKAQVPTIRSRLLKIGARLVISVRRVVLHLAAACPLQELFAHLARRLQRLAASG